MARGAFIASADLKNAVRPTTIVRSSLLDKALGSTIVFASETFQHTGSFKFRAAFNVAAKVQQQKLIAASSGNFGQALAYACSLLGKSCIVVMPSDSAQVKIDAVRSFGGVVELVDVGTKSRAQRVAELALEHPDAAAISAFDHPLVIEGNSSLGAEIAAMEDDFDYVIVPVGGGGLLAGVIAGLQRAGSETLVIGAEPLLANDAAISLRAGKIITNESEPKTVADGARTLSLGKHNWEIISRGVSQIVEVPEENIEEGVRLLFARANLKSEPTGALTLGAVLTRQEFFLGKKVCCVVSGGNVDPAVYARILTS